MTNTRLLWLPKAEQDLHRMIHFLKCKNPAAARNALLIIRAGTKQLIDMPKMGYPIANIPDQRELVLSFGAGAYIIRYYIQKHDVIIIRIWHSREERNS